MLYYFPDPQERKYYGNVAKVNINIGKLTDISFVYIPVCLLFTMALTLSGCKATSKQYPKSTLTLTSNTTSQTTLEELPPIMDYKGLNLLINNDPAEIDNTGFPITPVGALGITGSAPDVDITKYTFTVFGLVDNPLTLSYDSMLKYPPVSQVVLLICAGAFVDNAEWTGVALTDILSEAKIKDDASYLIIHGLDGYEQVLDLQDIKSGGVLLAYKVNGQILPKEHGYPVRLVVPGEYGFYWVKWVNRIEVK